MMACLDLWVEMVFPAYLVHVEIPASQVPVSEALKALRVIRAYLVIQDPMDCLEMMADREDRAEKVKR